MSYSGDLESIDPGQNELFSLAGSRAGRVDWHFKCWN